MIHAHVEAERNIKTAVADRHSKGMEFSLADFFICQTVCVTVDCRKYVKS